MDIRKTKALRYRGAVSLIRNKHEGHLTAKFFYEMLFI